MKKYIGTKEVQAEPMNELEAVELGYARSNEDNHEWREGYHVVYPEAITLGARRMCLRSPTNAREHSSTDFI